MIDKAKLPDEFLTRVKNQVDDYSDFVSSIMTSNPPVSIRLNNVKTPVQFNWNLGAVVPWNSSGRYLEERPFYKRDPLFHAGCYYPMEASSMFLEHVLDQIELEQDDLILDLCAAPGGKSLILRDHFPKNPVISNEIDSKRVHVLKENVIKWGSQNHLVVQSDAKRLSESGLKYHLIMIDAPCSGEGLFRKDIESRNEWTVERASGCSVRQREILQDVLPMFATGAYLIYSTCTYNPEENDERIQQLLETELFELIEINLDPEWNIVKSKYGYQFWPHRLNGEGFYCSLLRFVGENKQVDFPSVKSNKKEKKEIIRTKLIPEDFFVQIHDQKVFASTNWERKLVSVLEGYCKFVRKSLYLGELKGADLIPSYDFAMSAHGKTLENRMELTDSDAMKYLSGQALILAANKGPVLLTYRGVALGVGKSNGQRINNLLPKHLRVNF